MVQTIEESPQIEEFSEPEDFMDGIRGVGRLDKIFEFFKIH